jgi:hypothetical protein
MQSQGEDYSSQIRMAAMQTLTPQEQQIVAQAVTPQFIQVMAKLFGDQAVSILKPLMGLPAMPPSAPTSLTAFNAQAGANGNPQFQPPEAESQAEDTVEGQEEPCPQCGGRDPNCPACSLAYPTPVNF